MSDLSTLLVALSPVLDSREFVFVSRQLAKYGDGAELKPIATFAEAEGMTLIVTKDLADLAGEKYHGVFRMITLQVHSSLEAVGLTASVAGALSDQGISANMVAAFYHDHIFVPSSRARDAMDTLAVLTADARSNG